MRWRPEGWKNLYSQMVKDFSDEKTKLEAATTSKVFEAGADAMAKKLVEWLGEPCLDSIPIIILRSECAVCMAILRKEVGLEG